jgi:hypothetical protein
MRKHKPKEPRLRQSAYAQGAAILDHIGAGHRARFRSFRNQKFADSPVEGNGFELSVPRAKEMNPVRAGTVTEATKVGLEAVAYLSGYRWALTLDPR